MAQENFTTDIERRMPTTGAVYMVDRMTSQYAQAHPFDVDGFLEQVYQKYVAMAESDGYCKGFVRTREELRRQWNDTLAVSNPAGDKTVCPYVPGSPDPARLEVWHKAGAYWRVGLHLGETLPAIVPSTRITRLADGSWISLFEKDRALLGGSVAYDPKTNCYQHTPDANNTPDAADTLNANTTPDVAITPDADSDKTENWLAGDKAEDAQAGDKAEDESTVAIANGETEQPAPEAHNPVRASNSSSADCQDDISTTDYQNNPSATDSLNNTAAIPTDETSAILPDKPSTIQTDAAPTADKKPRKPRQKKQQAKQYRQPDLFDCGDAYEETAERDETQRKIFAAVGAVAVVLVAVHFFGLFGPALIGLLGCGLLKG